MAPKKKEVQKLSLGEFMTDNSFGSWADEVEDSFGNQTLPHSDRRGGYGSGYGQSDRPSYPPRDNYPTQLPSKPPFTAHLGNLSYDATSDTVAEFFTGCEVVSVRIVEDREQQRPKGFGYVEFASVDGLKQALTLDGSSFEGRSIRIRIADPPKDRDGRGDPGRELDWSRRGAPLPDIPRANDRRPGPPELSDRRSHREPADDGKSRDLSDWSRRGPLSPRPDQTRQPSSRDGSRPPNDGARSDPFGRSNRRASPAAWGEGRQQEGSRPPRREFADRPERAPTAAERDMQWRNSMRPDTAAKSPGQSRSGSEAPPSPAPSAAVPASTAAPVGRPRLNLAKRTVSDAPDVTSPALMAPDSKASPFGAARPIDTAAREREVAEKRQAQLREKKEVEEKAKEERRIAKEEAAVSKNAEDSTEPVDVNGHSVEANETQVLASDVDTGDSRGNPPQHDQPAENKDSTDEQVPVRPREPRESREGAPTFKSRATESGNWRQSGDQRGPRGAPTGPRRGGGASRGNRHDGPRPPRANGGGTASATGVASLSQPSTPVTAESTPAAPEEDGWTTVKKPNRNARPVVS